MWITKLVTAGALALAMGVSGVSAATFSGSSSGTFFSSNVGGGTNSCRFSTGGGTRNGVAWGDLGPCPDFSGNNQDSRIVIENYAFSEEVLYPGAKVQIGSFFWDNLRNLNARDFAAIGRFNLTLTSPVAGTVTEGLAFNITNSDNVAGGTNDLIFAQSWDNYGLTLPVTLGSSPLSITAFTFELLGNTTGESLTFTDGGRELNWSNPETNRSRIGIYAHVAAVPLPAAGWVLLSAIGGLAAAARRRKST